MLHKISDKIFGTEIIGIYVFWNKLIRMWLNRGKYGGHCFGLSTIHFIILW